MNQADVMKLIRKTANRWSNWRLPTDPDDLIELVEEWHHDLSHIDLEHAVAAIRALSLEGGDWPPPLGAIAVEAQRLAGHPVAPTAEEAWLEVDAAIRKGGHRSSPVWSHPAVSEGLKGVGGFRTLCLSENQMADRAHFLRMYEPVRTAWLRRECSPPSLQLELERQTVRALGEAEGVWIAVQADPVRVGLVDRAAGWDS